MESYSWVVDPLSAQASLEKAQKLVKRANKKGLNGGYSVELVKKVNPENEAVYYEIVVSGTPYEIGGWTFVGVIEWVPESELFITKSSPNYEGAEIDRSLVKQNACDHCGTNRKRNYQIVVENAEGERKVVGSTCTKDFLGWVFSPTFIDSEKDLEESFRGYGSDYERPQTSVSVLETALAIIAEIDGGYIPSSKLGATKDKVLNFELICREEAKSPQYPSPFTFAGRSIDSGKYKAQAEALIVEGRKFVADKSGSYYDNLKVALESEFAFPSLVGLLISIIPVLKKVELEAIKAKAEAEKRLEIEGEVTIQTQFAEVGTKVVLNQAKVVDVHGFDGAYGWVQIFTFVAEGARFKWFSTGGFDAEIGSTVNLKGTVKGFDTYKDANSTLLTRCSEVKPKLTKAEKEALKEIEWAL